MRHSARLAVDHLSGVPVGIVLPYAGATVPKGWLSCDGSAISRSIYARLFAAIGTTHGVGDGSTTFNVPDCTGRAVFGKEASETRITTANSGINGGTLGATGGDEELYQHSHSNGTLSAASAGAHTHNVLVDDQVGSAGNTEINVTNASSGTQSLSNKAASDGAHAHSVTGSTSTAGGNTTSQNIPPAIILNYIIKF